MGEAGDSFVQERGQLIVWGYVNRPNLDGFHCPREALWRMDSETEKSREHCELLYSSFTILVLFHKAQNLQQPP